MHLNASRLRWKEGSLTWKITWAQAFFSLFACFYLQKSGKDGREEKNSISSLTDRRGKVTSAQFSRVKEVRAWRKRCIITSDWLKTHERNLNEWGRHERRSRRSTFLKRDRQAQIKRPAPQHWRVLLHLLSTWKSSKMNLYTYNVSYKALTLSQSERNKWTHEGRTSFSKKALKLNGTKLTM